MKYKVALIGCNYPWSLETFYLKYLSAFKTLEFTLISTSEFRDKHYKISDKILNRFFPSKNIFYDKLNKHLNEEVDKIKPEIILIFKGMEIYPSTLNLWKKQGILLTNYNPDHPFIIESRGGGNKNVTNSVGLYHHHFCYSLDLCDQIRDKFNIPTTFLPFGFELTDGLYEEVATSDEVNRVCFIGNPDQQRVDSISRILSSGISVDVFGHHWDKTSIKKRNNVNIFPAVGGRDFWFNMRRYRVQLNIFRKHNIGSHNMRTFEIPAVGGLQLTPFSAEQAQFFKPEEEVFFYRSDEEMMSQINKMLDLNESDSSLIRQNARKRSIVSDYSYSNRARLMSETLSKLPSIS